MENGLPGFQALSSGGNIDLILLIFSSAVSLGGIYLSYLFFLKKPSYSEGLAFSAPGNLLRRFFSAGWGFDAAYSAFVVRPFVFLARLNRNDFLDLFYGSLAEFCRNLHLVLSLTQTGKLRWYAMVVVVGAIVFIGAVILL